jgi:hypothetical protein
MKKLPLKTSALFYLHLILNMVFGQVALSQSSVELINNDDIFNFWEIPLSLTMPIIMATFWPMYFHYIYIDKKYKPMYFLVRPFILTLISFLINIFLIWLGNEFILLPFLITLDTFYRIFLFFYVLYICLWQMFIIFLMDTFNKMQHSKGAGLLLNLTITFIIVLVIAKQIHPSVYGSLGIRFFAVFYKILIISALITTLKNMFNWKINTYTAFLLFLSINISIAYFFTDTIQKSRRDVLIFIPALNIYSIIWFIIFYRLIKTYLNKKSHTITWIEESHSTKG